MDNLPLTLGSLPAMFDNPKLIDTLFYMTEEDKDKLEFEKALDLRKFEIDNFWKRGWFFGALLLAIISGYITISGLKNPNFPIICISFLAFLISVG